jgi:hypothetical protein
MASLLVVAETNATMVSKCCCRVAPIAVGIVVSHGAGSGGRGVIVND